MILLWALLSTLSLEEWRDQINFKGWDASLWTHAGCEQLMARVPSTTNQVENALLLHATKQDPYLKSARLHFEALQKLGVRKRDIYFVVTCGGESTAVFIHAFLRKLENFYVDLTTPERVQIAMLGKLFPMIDKVKFVWNEGRPLDHQSFSPWTLAPVGTAQRGFWSGHVRLKILDAQILGQKQNELNGRMMDAIDSLVREGRSSEWSWRALHDEHEQLVNEMGSRAPWAERLANFFNPRSFFFRRGWEWMLNQQWQAPTMTLFSEKGVAEIDLELHFLGAKDEPEIEALVADVFGKYFKGLATLEVQTVHLSPFIRSVYEGIEARVFDRVIRDRANTVPVPTISTELTESKLFREVSISTYEFSPYVGRSSFFQSRGVHEQDLSAEEFARALDLEVAILKELLR